MVSKTIGKVCEEYNETMPFANVLVKGQTLVLQLILMKLLHKY